MSNRATLKDVAARAGVSLTTVSLFLNGNESVCSRDTAERIREAISELNYTKGRSGHLSSRPAVGVNLPAGEGMMSGYGYATATLAPPSTGIGLRPLPAEAERAAARLRARSRTLGMGISPAFDLLDPNDAGPSHLADLVWHGASRMAEWDDYRLLSYPASVRNASDPSPFLDGSVAGLILTGGYEDPRPARLAEAGLAVVLLGPVSGHSRWLRRSLRAGARHRRSGDEPSSGTWPPHHRALCRAGKTSRLVTHCGRCNGG